MVLYLGAEADRPHYTQTLQRSTDHIQNMHVLGTRKRKYTVRYLVKRSLTFITFLIFLSGA